MATRDNNKYYEMLWHNNNTNLVDSSAAVRYNFGNIFIRIVMITCVIGRYERISDVREEPMFAVVERHYFWLSSGVH